jgi:peptide/nickel transport system ATP-binding protein
MLNVNDLTISFTRYGRGVSRDALKPVCGLNLDVKPGELLAVIGSSGSGKSLLAHAILGILPGNCRVEGGLFFCGEPLTPRRQKALRGRSIALIPQSVGFLNPLVRLGGQVRRAAVLSGMAGRQAHHAADTAFARYGLAPAVRKCFPHQVSGGMARRVLSATATVGDADLIIADEPTTGLHREASRESLGFLRALADAGKSVLVITHDLKAVLPWADRVAVFHGGTTVELTAAANFSNDLSGLRHPYSRAMWMALPENEFAAEHAVSQEGGQGCPFTHLCGCSDAACAAAPPAPVLFEDGFVRCHHA